MVDGDANLEKKSVDPKWAKPKKPSLIKIINNKNSKKRKKNK